VRQPKTTAIKTTIIKRLHKMDFPQCLLCKPIDARSNFSPLKIIRIKIPNIENRANSLIITKELVSGSGDIDRNASRTRNGIKKEKHNPKMVYAETGVDFFIKNLLHFVLQI
jgi:hypothetical protein